MPSLILASASPRRKELLTKVAKSFEIVVSCVEEIEPPACHWSDAVLLNAIAKAKAVAELRPDDMVLAADTVIELNGRILGKPRDLDDARAMLRLMSGSVHNVSTGVCLVSLKGNVLCSFVDVSVVRFKHLSDNDIELYLSMVHVLDKAGAYAIQENGHIIIESVEGSMDNVMGLPVDRVAEAIAASGYGWMLK